MFVDWILVIDRYLYLAGLVIAVNIDVDVRVIAPAGTKTEVTGLRVSHHRSLVTGHRSQIKRNLMLAFAHTVDEWKLSY